MNSNFDPLQASKKKELGVGVGGGVGREIYPLHHLPKLEKLLLNIPELC